ncbi:glycosyltransferase family 1 protein [Sphingobacterium sp. SRCM116780]|uniref:glycosyltransferase family 4 protein n=1 Tax=Sphingobacterium sp. SRCM116780 TaxID=2907623 RepID=UPI001F359C23|nr:glycosyltransferase family 1 protein [Sphingobacterium sp. SRCM116780]UIR55356.1 glycosyltransferase family 1 protein [Sphingobacterium sp. SRCM116780]
MIRVAFFAEIMIPDFDGAARTIFQLVNRIDKKKFEFLFIYGTGPDQIQDFESLKIPALSLPIQQNYTMAIPSFVDQRIKKKLYDFNPDIIHIATPSLLGFYAQKYALKNQIPIISIYHTHFVSYIDYYLRRIPFLIQPTKNKIIQTQNKFYNNCDKVYVPTNSIVSELITMGVYPALMQIWKRGIDNQLFSPKKRNRNWLKKITQNDHPTILFASRLVWEKNLETLIAIYTILKQENLSFNFIIAGDGSAMESCQSSMPDALFLGKLDHKNLAKLYASSSVFVFPSHSETYGNVVIEAMASGLPCVIADGGGSADLIKEGVNGFKCQPKDASMFVNRILQLLQHEKLRKQIGMEALLFSKSLDWNSLADVYFEDLEKMSKNSAHSLFKSQVG